ncbi:MAG: MFS transporter [Clostridia bacterium]|nr:MFS transporter [Clostridia bacterium]
MKQLATKKEVNTLALLFMFTYMVSYITRINYGTIVSEMENATGIARSLLSMALTGSFVTYGVGQIISGILGDRFSPKKMVSTGFIVTILMNVLIPLCQNPYLMLAVWCINGFAQSFMWPPLVRMMAGLLTDKDYKRVVLVVNWGSSFGTILLYLISPLIITLAGYKAVFFFSAACGLAMLVIWNLFASDIEVKKEETLTEIPQTKRSLGPLFKPFMIGVMVAIILQGMLRDGVTTWMPSYISETYNLSSAVSILTGVILPIFSIVSFQVASALYRKKFKNPVLCAGVIFGAGAVSALVLYLLTGQSAVFSVAFSALLTGCMHGVNLLLISMIPAFFQRFGNVSTVSGVLNSCTYIGSAISTYGIALLSERMGWSFTLLAWLAIALAGTVICLTSAKPWQKEMKDY